ncbi:hypothetical protein KF707_09865 [Candidatus Obscuribacterales bacterium]|nr:hypothetical protein [Candidatus Obscuribacterales bacterium]
MREVDENLANRVLDVKKIEGLDRSPGGVSGVLMSSGCLMVLRVDGHLVDFYVHSHSSLQDI